MAATIIAIESSDASNTQKPCKALIFDPARPDELTEEEDADELNKDTNRFEIQLPRWSNRVVIFADQAKTRYVGTLRLNRLGFVKNCRRRLGYDYKVLYVKKYVPYAKKSVQV